MEMEKKHQFDDTYVRAMTFANNFKEKHPGLSNVYVVKSIDKDGNTTSEHYGMNLLTDNGFKKFFIDNQTFPTELYIGRGSSSFDVTSASLVEVCPNTHSSRTDDNMTPLSYTVSNSTINYAYPMYYDKASNLVTVMCRYMIAYYDYNITGITEDFSVSEYGIGTRYNSLWTHSWVYDIHGNQTYLTKKVNERLEFTVYMCMSYYTSLITNGYANNRFTIITTMRAFFEERMYENSIYTYKRYNVGASRGFSNTTSGIEDGRITRTTNLNSITMYAVPSDATSNSDDKAKAAGYIDGFVQWTSGQMTIEPQFLDTPETFTTTQICKWDNAKPTGIADRFGEWDGPAITQADIQSVCMYNYYSGEWDNDEDFYNNPDHWYSETPMQTAFSTPIYYKNNDEIITMYVYPNMRTDDPIIGFKNTTLQTIYATDAYWDFSSWQRITNFADIPSELQTKRYYITNANSLMMTPIRESGDFRIIPTHGDYENMSWYTSRNGSYPSCDNYEYGWFKRDNLVCVPDRQLTFSVGNAGANSSATMTYGKWMIVFNSVTSFMSVNMDNVKTTGETPSAITVQTDLSTQINLLTAGYRSKSDTGLICIQNIGGSEGLVIDLRGDELVQHVIQSKMSTCVWGKNQVAYIPSSDTTKVRVYDYDTNTDIREFDIPEGSATVVFMVAHGDYVWITDGSTYVYCMTISSGDVQACTNTLPFSSGINYVETTAVDDVIIIYKSNDTNVKNAYYIKKSDPTNILSLKDFFWDVTYLGSQVKYDLRYVHKSTDESSNKKYGTLILLITMNRTYSKTGAYNQIIDFGVYLNSGTYRHNRHYADERPAFIPYGEFYIVGNKKVPIEYYVHHQIKGTTKTITTINNIKNISKKQWNTVITNRPEFMGKPPGVQAELKSEV